MARAILGCEEAVIGSGAEGIGRYPVHGVGGDHHDQPGAQGRDGGAQGTGLVGVEDAHSVPCARHEDPRAPGQVGTDVDVVESRLAGQPHRLVGLTRCDLDDE